MKRLIAILSLVCSSVLAADYSPVWSDGSILSIFPTNGSGQVVTNNISSGGGIDAGTSNNAAWASNRVVVIEGARGATGAVYAAGTAATYNSGTRVLTLGTNAFGGSSGTTFDGGLVPNNVTITNARPEIKGTDTSGKRWWRLAEETNKVTLWRKTYLETMNIASANTYFYNAGTNSQIARWDFETTNTTQTLDTGFYGYNLHASNRTSVAAGPTLTVLGTNQYGRVENGYAFSGANQYFETTNSTLYTLGTNATLSFWTYRTKAVGTRIDYLNHYNTGSPFAGFGVADNNSDGKLGFWDGAAWRVLTSVAVPTQRWVHVAIALSGSTVTCYTNGIKDLSPTLVAVAASTQPFRIGVDSGLNTYYQGTLDAVNMFSRQLTSNEVWQMYLYTHPINNTEWRMGSAVGGTTNITTNATEEIVFQSAIGTNSYGNTNSVTQILGNHIDALATVDLNGNSFTNGGSGSFSNLTVSGPVTATNFTGGAMNFGGNAITTTGLISGNGSGMTNTPKVIRSSDQYAALGFAMNQNYSSGYQTTYADTDAQLWNSFKIGENEGGTFKVRITFGSIDQNNTGKSMGTVIYTSTSTNAGAVGWNVFSAAAWSIPVPSLFAVNSAVTYGTAFAVPDNCQVGVALLKNDNAGGAAGSLIIWSVELVRQ